MSKKPQPQKTPAPAAASDRRETLLLALLLVAAVWLVYGQTGSFEFVDYDDGDYVTGNRQVQRGLSAEGLRWAFTAFSAANWHPLTWLSHMLDISLFGLNAGPHHLVSVVWHSLNTVLFFLVFARMTKCRWKSAFVAALFALHPLHVESVAWVAERKDVLSTFFFALTLYLYAAYTERPGPARYAGTLVVFALGLLAKPMLVTVPCVLLLLDVWPLGRWRAWKGGGGGEVEGRSARSLVVEKLPFFVLSAASAAVTLVAQTGAIVSTDKVPLAMRFALAVQGYVIYIAKLFWPTRLASLYPLPTSISPWSTAGCTALLVVLSAGVFLLARRRPWLPIGWLWYVGTLVPVIGIVQVGQQAYADRYTYVSYVGLFVLLTWGAAETAERFRVPRRVLGAGAGAVLLALGVAAWLQTGYWRNSLALFGRCVEVTPENYIARSNYGGALTEAGRLEEAAAQYVAGLRINPDFAPGHMNFAEWLRIKGEYRRAIWHYNQALRIDPAYPMAAERRQYCRQELARAAR